MASVNNNNKPDPLYTQAYGALNWVGAKAVSLVTKTVKTVLEMGVTDIDPETVARYRSVRKGHEPQVAIYNAPELSPRLENEELYLIPDLIKKGYLGEKDRCLGMGSCTNRVANLFKKAGML